MAVKQEVALAEQQLALRKQLLAQRAIIKDVLETPPQQQFPRSKTIRFVTEHSDIFKFIFRKTIAATVVATFLKRKSSR